MCLLRSSFALVLSLFSIASIASVCLFDSQIAATPIATMTMMNSASATASDSQSADQEATELGIESAITSNNRIFWIYVGVLVVGAILTVMLFKSGNRVQEAIKADADARLKSSEERIAALTVEGDKAKERIAVLTVEAEKARAGITKGQADAARAIERTSMLELENAKQQLENDQQRERTAKAEKDLLLMKEGLKPRHLTVEQLTSLLKDLSSGERGEIQIDFVSGNLEAENFALDIAKVLHATGWTVGKMGATTFLGKTPVGVSMIVRDPETPRVSSLVSAFEHIGISVPVKPSSKASDPVLLIIGHKP